MSKKIYLWHVPCAQCGRKACDHVWRCSGCGEPLPTDDEGFPIFEGHGGMFADLTCPPSASELN